MRTTLIILVGILFANTANALSCMSPNIARSFNWHADSDATYQVGLGILTPTEKIVVPKKTKRDIGVPYSIKAKFTGRMLGLSGLGKPTEFPLTVDITCAAHWCGAFPQQTAEAVVYIKRTDGNRSVSFGPCDWASDDLNVEKQINVLKKCLRKGRCSDQQIKSLERF